MQIDVHVAVRALRGVPNAWLQPMGRPANAKAIVRAEQYGQ